MSNNSSNNKRIAKNTLFLYVRMIFVLLISLYTTRVVLNALGVVDYGIYNVVAGFVSMFAFLNTSMSNGVQRFYNYEMGQKFSNLSQVYNTSIQVQFLISIILLVLLETVGIWYMQTKMVIPLNRLDTAMSVFQLSVFSLIVVVMQVPFTASIMAHERMNFYAYISIFDVSAKLGIAYLLTVLKNDRLYVYAIMTFLVTVGNFILSVYYAKKNFNEICLKRYFSIERFKSMLSFSGWNLFGSFAYLLKGQGLNLLLNAFFGPVVNAARGISNMIHNSIQGFQSNIVIAFRPQIVQSYAENEMKRVKQLFYSLSKISFIMLTVLSVPVIIELEYILNLWLGDVVPDYTYSFTILIMVNMIISSLNTPISQIVHATGKMKEYQLGTSLVICSILPISFFFLKIGYGANVVFIVSLVITVINQYICMILLRKVFSYNMLEYFNMVIKPCAIFTAIIFPISYLPCLIFSSSFFRVIIVGALDVSISCVVTYCIVMNKDERNVINIYIKKFLNKK